MDALMGVFADRDSAGNIIQATYQSVLSGVPAGDPFQLTIIRRARVRDENGPAAPCEEVSVKPADFATPPDRGDWLTAWGTNDVVTSVNQPGPYGWATLVLMRRGGQVL